MFSKYIYPFLAVLRDLSWHEIRDMFLFARRRLKEESLQQVAAASRLPPCLRWCRC